MNNAIANACPHLAKREACGCVVSRLCLDDRGRSIGGFVGKKRARGYPVAETPVSGELVGAGTVNFIPYGSFVLIDATLQRTFDTPYTVLSFSFTAVTACVATVCGVIIPGRVKVISRTILSVFMSQFPLRPVVHRRYRRVGCDLGGVMEVVHCLLRDPALGFQVIDYDLAHPCYPGTVRGHL
ncbi:MAG: hypothetical protein QOI07_906 [Verrucomicrobiota bacterium]